MYVSRVQYEIISVLEWRIKDSQEGQHSNCSARPDGANDENVNLERGLGRPLRGFFETEHPHMSRCDFLTPEKNLLVYSFRKKIHENVANAPFHLRCPVKFA